MPFKSQAQRRKFAELLVKGEISPETFEEWSRETGSAKLPEHVEHKPKKRSAAKKTGGTKSVRKKVARKKTSSRGSATRKPRTKTKRSRVSK